jgi:UDP-N-acetylglucosamine 3-dehydrogenase
MAKIRVAVIGAGGIGGTHLRAYAALNDLCEIVAVADVDPAAAAARGAEFGAAPYPDYRTLLDSAKPDAISICTPPNVHRAVVEAAAERHIAILCEKPPARTLAETQAIVDTVTASGTLLQFAFCHRFHEPVQQARALIESGRLGRLVQMYNRFGFRFARAGQSWFTQKEIAGGGVLIDTLVHSVDLFRALTGSEITTVSASTSTTLPGLEVEDSASLLVTSASGVAGSLNCSWVTPVSEAEIRLYGSEGQVVIDYAQAGGIRYQLAGMDGWVQEPFEGPDRFTAQARFFLNCVQTGAAPRVGGHDGLQVMRVIEGAYQSVTEGRSVQM